MLAAGKPPAWAKVGPWRLVLFLLFIAGGFWLMILPYAGDLVRDHRLAGTWQPAYDVRVTDGKCTRHQLVLTTCEAKINSLAEPGKAPVKIGFMMGFTGGGGERMVPLRSTLDPSAVTIAYAAQTELTNRTLTFFVMTFGLAAAFLATVGALLRGRYVGGAAHQALLAGFEELSPRAEPAHAGRRATA